MNDADIQTLELADAARWGFCSSCGDEVRRASLDADGRCGRCADDGADAPPSSTMSTSEERAARLELEYADEHEGGQLRIGAAGDQMPLLALPDATIPCRAVAELLGDPLAELTPAAVAVLRGQTTIEEEG